LLDNAVAERLFHSFSVAAVHGEAFASRAALREAVFDGIDVYYKSAARADRRQR
jgi:hypothetical protein